METEHPLDNGEKIAHQVWVLSGQLYLVQVWPIPCSSALVITRAVFQFIRGSKMELFCWVMMHKSANNKDKNVPDVALTLMVTIVCGCA